MRLALLTLCILAMSLLGCAQGSGDTDLLDPPGDPTEFVTTLASHVRAGEWDSVLRFLPSRMHDYSPEDVRMALRIGADISEGWIEPLEDPEEWQLEDWMEAGRIVLRSTSYPMIALTLREQDGGWVLEPGPYAEAALGKISGGVAAEDLLRPSPADFEWVAGNPGDALRSLGHEVRALKQLEGSHFVTIRLETRLTKDITIPLDQLRWSSPEGDGRAEVVWGTAIFEDGRAILPGLRDEGTAGRYRLTLRLDDPPEAGEIALHLGSIQWESVEPLSLEYRFNLEDFWFSN